MIDTRQAIGLSKDPSCGPRVLMLSQRRLEHLLTRCVSYEFEDVIREIDDVELVAPTPSSWYRLGSKIALRASRRLGWTMNPGIGRIGIERDYDLFVAVCQFPWDLLALQALPDWRRRSGCAVCWLEEIWPTQVEDLGGFLRILSEFDHVFVNNVGGYERLKSALSSQCHYLPPGVDAIRFCPYPNPAARSVHVYSIGRRSPVIHESLLRQADRERLLYIYDTINVHAPKQTDDYISHRNLLANIAKRSRYFPVNVGKMNRKDETAGFEEFGFRFFEGAAAGAVMFGGAPDTEAFHSHFDWPNAVIPVPYDSPDIVEILGELDRQPERLSQIRRDNVVNSLLRHDWLHRWRSVLDVVGLKPSPACQNREKRLEDLAEMVDERPES